MKRSLATFSAKMVAPNREAALSHRIAGLLNALYPQGLPLERRREKRYPYPHLVTLQPVGPDGRTPHGEVLVVAGKHLSENGLGFFHQDPIPHRRVIAWLDGCNGQWLGLLLDLTWCRFTRQGWYESGGHFRQDVTTRFPQPPQRGLTTIDAEE